MCMENKFRKLNTGRKKTIVVDAQYHLLAFRYTIMKMCWSLEPTQRPTFSKIGELIEQLLSDQPHQVSIFILLPDTKRIVYVRDKRIMWVLIYYRNCKARAVSLKHSVKLLQNTFRRLAYF